MKELIHTCLVVVLMLAVGGCAVTSQGYRGQTINSNDVVTIQRDGSHSDTWETFDLVIDYQYENDDGLLHITGRVELGQHYQVIYDRVSYLWVYLLLTDADDVVIESISLPAYMTHTEDFFTFSRFVKLTNEVKGVSFGYDGQVAEFDGLGRFYYP